MFDVVGCGMDRCNRNYLTSSINTETDGGERSPELRCTSALPIRRYLVVKYVKVTVALITVRIAIRLALANTCADTVYISGGYMRRHSPLCSLVIYSTNSSIRRQIIRGVTF